MQASLHEKDSIVLTVTQEQMKIIHLVDIALFKTQLRSASLKIEGRITKKVRLKKKESHVSQ